MESGGSDEVDEDPGGFVGPVFPYWQKQPGNLINFHLNQEEAQKRVAFCIKHGGVAVDLSYVALGVHLPQRLPPPCNSGFFKESGLSPNIEHCICSKSERRRYGHSVTIHG